MKRPEPGKMYGASEASWEDPNFAGEYPHIHGYLSKTTYDDGQPRVVATLLIFVESGALKLCLNDRDNNRSVFLSRPSFSEALHALDKGLSDNSLEWKRKQDYNAKASQVPF